MSKRHITIVILLALCLCIAGSASAGKKKKRRHKHVQETTQPVTDSAAAAADTAARPLHETKREQRKREKEERRKKKKLEKEQRRKKVKKEAPVLRKTAPKPAPVVKKKLEVKYPVTRRHPVYRIEVLSPMYLDELVKDDRVTFKSKIPEKAVAGLNFFEGVMIAADSLKAAHINVDIYVHDITSAAEQPDTLVQKGLLDSADLIIGAVPSKDVAMLAAYAKRKQVNFISALSPADGGVHDNYFFTLLQPSLRSHCEWIGQDIAKKYPGRQVTLLCRTTQPADDNAAKYLMQDTAAKVSYQKVVCDTLPAAGALDALIDTALKQAGLAHFEKGSNYNYSEVSLLLSDGLTFLTENTETLQKGGMPARFVEAYTTAKTDFDNQHVLYGAAKGNATDGTNNKIAANNTLFTSTKLMLADAVTIFAEQPAIQKQFTLAAIQRMVTTNGVSGIHFVVRDSETKKPLDTAAISIVGQQQPFTVNKRGVLDIKLPKATYYFTVTIQGYTSFHGSVILDANVMRRTEVLATKAESASIAS